MTIDETPAAVFLRVVSWDHPDGVELRDLETRASDGSWRPDE
jgi:hypothetical protein